MTRYGFPIGLVAIVFSFSPFLAKGVSDQDPGTRRMIALLAKVAADADPRENLLLNDRRAELARKSLSDAQSFQDRLRGRMRLGYELLLAGRTDQALEQWTRVREEFAARSDIRPGVATVRQLREFFSLAYLRLGEQENCVSHHGVDSCLMPIRGTGIHTVRRGSREATKELTATLEAEPDDLSARWLLNLAYMTLGGYPDRVPAKWRIDPKVFESDYDIKRFFDVAPGLGLDVVALSGGSVVEDLDGDGYLDIMVSSFGLSDQLRFFRNEADGTFSDRTAEAGLIGEVGGLNLTHADYNNDGYPDVLVLRGAWLGKQGRHPNSLLRNNGDGTFADVTEQAGLLCFHPTQTAAWADYDNDGWLDLYIGNESTSRDTHRCQLFRNNGDGTFTDVAKDLGLDDIGFVKGVAWGDYNNDGCPDLYLSRLAAPNKLFRNDGPVRSGGSDRIPPYRFTEVSDQAGVTKPLMSFPTWFWDYDNDGWQDLLVATFAGYSGQDLDKVAGIYLGLPVHIERPSLYHNNGDGTFTNVSKAARLDTVLLAMGANFGDLDNDGFLDCYFGTGQPDLGTLVPNRMFRNAGGRVFQDVTTSGGFGHLQKGHGISFADLDNDGDQDVYAVMGGAYSGDVYQNVLFENPGHGHHWITLVLEGVRSNRSAIGTRIRVVVETKDGDRQIHRTVGTGGSFGSSTLRAEIGLGNARSIRRIEIRWPSGGPVQTLHGLRVDHIFKVREGVASPVEVRLRKFDLSPTRQSNQPHAHRHLPGPSRG